MKKSIIFATILATIGVDNAFSAITPTPYPADNRILQVSYQDNNVVTIKGQTFTSTQLVFGADERVLDVEGGDAGTGDTDDRPGGSPGRGRARSPILRRRNRLRTGSAPHGSAVVGRSARGRRGEHAPMGHGILRIVRPRQSKDPGRDRGYGPGTGIRVCSRSR